MADGSNHHQISSKAHLFYFSIPPPQLLWAHFLLTEVHSNKLLCWVYVWGVCCSLKNYIGNFGSACQYVILVADNGSVNSRKHCYVSVFIFCYDLVTKLHKIFGYMCWFHSWSMDLFLGGNKCTVLPCRMT